ncbi:MAG: glycosyltransferase [Betaproteobacteria bacterium]|nr:glycosyltransferase [Betaproteobacteria bacterium]
MIYCVIVTYGQRKALLYATLQAALGAGIERAVVVDNGSHWDVTRDVEADFGTRVDVVRLQRNCGSAPGFKAGMARALRLGAEHLLILDDDLGVNQETIDQLQRTLQSLATNQELSKCAVCAYRKSAMERMIRIEGHRLVHEVAPNILRFSSARIFKTIFLAASKYLQRHGPGNESGVALSGTVPVAFAPYGGVFIHRSAVESIGLPDERFALYWDDIEWTYRITDRGGSIVIDCDAPLDELEISHPFRKWRVSRFHSLLLREAGPADYRVYYEIRNAVYFAARPARHDVAWLGLRLAAFRIGVDVLGLILKRTRRARAIRIAIADGRSGRLGYNNDFPLE